MEWFWQAVEHLQKNAAFTALQSFAPVDWIFIFVIFWGLVQGSRKGFSVMFGKLLGVVIVSMLTVSFYQRAADLLREVLPMFSTKAAEPITFFLIAVFLWFSVSWGINAFGKFFKVEAQGLLKTLGGMLCGVLNIVLVFSFVVQFLLLLPMDSVQKSFKQGRTYTGYTISRFVPDLHKIIVSPFRKSFVRPSKVSE
jgi:uncharacterized membrane protein required for colicin V production